MKNKMYMDKEWLQRQFDEKKQAIAIAKICGVSDSTICYWATKLGVIKNPHRRMSARTRELNVDYFEVIDTEHKAYWLGFIVADGCITRTDTKYPPNRLHICLKDDDKEHLILFNKDIGGGYEPKTKLIENKKRNFESYVSEIKINSKPFVHNLMTHGIKVKKTGTEHIPNTIPKNLLRHFIRGYFDGDGSITIKKSFRICSASIIILEQIVDIFKSETGIELKVYQDKKSKKPFYTIDSNSRTNNKAALDYMYKDATIFLKRKYDRYIDFYCSTVK